jgi:hypothetical protein
MSQAPQHEHPPHKLRWRWFILVVPFLLGFVLLISVYMTLYAASGEQKEPQRSILYTTQFNSPEAPPAQTSNQNRFEIRYPSIDARHTTGVAWGDYDGDGDLDLAVGNGRFNTSGSYDMTNQLYKNSGGGTFEEIPLDQEGLARESRAVAWGDIDGDGDLDLVVANFEQKNQIYENDGGQLIYDPQAKQGWQSVDSAPSTSLALGDYDGDGDLDLAVGNDGEPDQVFRNINGTYRLRWQSPLSGASQTRAVAWGDVDGDGDLDLAVANYDGQDRIYENDGGRLLFDPAKDLGWQSESRDELADSSGFCTKAVNTPGFVDQYYKIRTRSLAWGDWDDDGDLDLAVGGGSDEGRSCGAFLKVYENVDGDLQFDPQSNLGWEWTDSQSMNKPSNLVWGDWNSDGKLDLFVGLNAGDGYGSRNRIYENRGGALVFEPGRGIGWESTLDADLDSETTYAIAVGDADADGDLDLAVGNGGSRNGGQKNLILKNAAPAIAFSPTAWISADARKSTDTAWGDWDGDGDLDLAVGNFGDVNQVYENVDGVLQFDPQNDIGWASTVVTDDLTTSVAWGDWDGDGDLDLAVGNQGQHDLVYENIGTTLSYSLSSGVGWVSPLISDTQSLAWGDWDRDGDLDLAAGHCGDEGGEAVPQFAVVYENDAGAKTLRLAPDETPKSGWMSGTPLCAKSVAWGDWDNDTDLDLVLGSRIYENYAGDLVLNSFRGWDGGIAATSVAWGDMDGDGDLDLAVGTEKENRVYENMDGNLLFNPRQGHGWESRDLKQTTDLAWGDVDGDKDLDLAVSNSADWKFQANQVFENVNGQLSSRAVWETAEPGVTEESLMRSQAVALGDMDNDGDLDLAFANFCRGSDCDSGERPNHIYINELQGGNMLVGSLPRLSIEQPYGKGSADFYASPQVLTTNAITIPFILRDSHEVPVGRIEVFYSLDGGDNWQEARSVEGTVTTNLETSTTGMRHEFVWDTFESGFFGKSDNVAIRMIAYDTPPQDQKLEDGSYRYFDGIAGSFQRPFVTATSFPFRVTSTQIQVVDADNDDAPVAGAWVFRLPAGQASGAELMPSPDNPLPTDSQGYLPGGGELEQGDRLVALSQVDASAAIPFTDKVTLFHTSGRPIKNGLLMRTFVNPGEVVLKVSKDNPLLLFHITMVLEWDARNDELFRTDLTDGILRASELLFDVTDGQAALGQVTVLQSKENWPYADVVVQADNAMRPSAAIGGFTQVPLSETVRINVSPENLSETKVISNAYSNNQIRMGTVWDPFGEYTADLGPDWWQALAHELSHYLLFLPDNYLGFKDEDVLGKIDCQGSFMTSTFNPEYSEFLTEEGWSDICKQSLAEMTTGRTDWETITNFYPMLKEPGPGKALEGPSNLPLGVTSVTFFDPNESRSTLRARNFEVRRVTVDEDGNQSSERWRLPSAQAYLYQTQGTSDLTDDILVQLGTPTGGGDRLKVRGAYQGDRLCLFDRSGDQAYAGCDSRLTSADVSIKVQEADNEWQPQIQITPVTSRTMQVSVTQSISDGRPLNVQLFPLHYWSKPDFVGLSPTAVMDSDGDLHTKELKFRLPAYEVAARVWIEGDPGRETIDIFKLNPPWQTAGPSSAAIGGPSSAGIGGPSSAAIGGPSSAGIGGPSSAGIGGPSSAGIGGPSSAGIGGPSSAGIGGPSSAGIGGPSSAGIGGPSSAGIGGPSSAGIGGPSSAGIGGPSSAGIGGAPILSADAQVVVYSKQGFFEENGLDTLQILSIVPQLNSHPWLVPVGQAYHVTLDPDVQSERIISLNYLQRDVPEGFEYTLTVYFLADGEEEWQRLETERYVENLVVADLQGADGTYAVMATIEMPELEPGSNLFAYPLPVSQPVSDALKSIEGNYSRVYEIDHDGQEVEVDEMQFGRVYWIDITAGEVMTPFLAPPIRQPDGQLGYHPAAETTP